MSTWFENDPQRYEKELQELQDAGVQVQIDEPLKAQQILRLAFTIEGDNPYFDLPDKTVPLRLTVVFPYSYPYFRPIVFAPEISQPRHFNPVGKNLCLLGRNTDEWDPETTLAAHLQSQLKKVLVQGHITDPQVLANDPNEQAEPESAYYEVHPVPVLFDPTGYIENVAPLPFVQLGGKIKVGIAVNNEGPPRLAVLESRNTEGALLGKLPDALAQLFSTTLTGVVYRLPVPPPHQAVDAFTWLQERLKEQNEKIYFHGTERKIAEGQYVKNVIALNFPEETTTFQKAYTGWLFLIILNVKQKAIGSGKLFYTQNALFARGSRISKEAFSIRIPKLKPLATKRVAVFGLGALGAPSAIELAKSGVEELRLLDFDFVDAATSVRWPLGLYFAGMAKTVALKKFLEQNYPATRVIIETIRIGDIPVFGEGNLLTDVISESDVMDRMLSDVSLVYDATVEYGIMHFLSQQARFRKVPYLSISATEGAWGGVIMRVLPGKTEGCWMCMRWHQFDGTIPNPPADHSGKIQAVGCGDISFTGAGFDLHNVSMTGVRFAVSTLCEGVPDAYATLKFDIGILHLVDENQNAILPRWDHLPLKKHPNCPYCAQV